MKIKNITILGGRGKDGIKEPVEEVSLNMGDIVSVVGPTGCGKTTLINDIELFANENTPSGRKVLINGEVQPEEIMFDPSNSWTFMPGYAGAAALTGSSKIPWISLIN